ncbi:hypothetical protein [uncultured Campylobacter sp.]|nr:hypothetical protein [uncultured Campylobacter sp.]
MKGDSIGDSGIFDIQGDDRILIEIYSRGDEILIKTIGRSGGILIESKR